MLRFKYYNPDDPTASVTIAGASQDPGKIFEDLPVLKDMSAAMDLLRTEVATTAEAAAKAKKGSDEAWAKALAAERLAKRAEAKADQTAAPEDIKVAGQEAGTAMQEKATSEQAMQAAREANDAAARAHTALLSNAYQNVMRGDARNFAEAAKTDRDILNRLDATLLTAQAFPPSLVVTPLQAGLPPFSMNALAMQ